MAAARVLLPVHDPPLSDAEVALLRDVVAAGAAAHAGLAPHDARHAAMRDGARYLFRRWLLETLLVLRVRGPLPFNALSKELGRPAGESLAPKLQDLEREGLVARRAAPHGRAAYALTDAGARLAEGAYALTIVKREHTRAMLAGVAPAALVGAVEARAGDLDAFVGAARAFASAHVDRRARADANLAVARRFAETCVRKWHGELMGILVEAGPRRFTELRAALGAGDQALSKALATLREFGSVERDGEGAWRATPLGRLDVAAGAPLILLLPRVHALHGV